VASGEIIRRQEEMTGGEEGNDEVRITATRTSASDVTACLFGDNIDENYDGAKELISVQ
jgi:hypothetical protein